jgi:triphosphatase
MAETELKLYAQPSDLAKLQDAVLGLAAVLRKPRSRRIVTDYYETPDLALAKSGIALRVRQAGRRHIQGVKTRGRAVDGAALGAGDTASAVVATRGEWEWPISGDTLDLRRLNEEPMIKELVPIHALGSLAPLFRTEIERTSVELKPDEGVTIEVSFDDGRIVADGGSAPICEIELELTSPAQPEGRAALYRLALELQRAAPVTIGTESKADRGYRLAARQAPRAIKSPAFALAAESSVRDGIRAILRRCIAHIVANQPAALADAATEGVHQMRVGVRRLRSATRLFEDFVASPEQAWIDGELKWLAGELGQARDWDVFATHTLPAASEAAGRRAELAAIARAAETRRRAAHAVVLRAISSPRYTTLILTLGGWLEADRWCERIEPATAGDLDDSLAETGRHLLARLGRKVRKAGRGIENAKPQERHKLRKALKRLRYGSDFLSSLYPRKRVKRQLGRLSDLQDVLGALNDFAVAEGLLSDLAGKRRRLRNTARELCRDMENRARRQMDDLAGDWRRYRKLDPFWA